MQYCSVTQLTFHFYQFSRLESYPKVKFHRTQERRNLLALYSTLNHFKNLCILRLFHKKEHIKLKINGIIYTCLLCLVVCRVRLCDPMDCSPLGSSVHGDPPGKDTGVGCYVLFQGIFPTQGSNPGFLHCRHIFYCLNHQGSLKHVSRCYCFS